MNTLHSFSRISYSTSRLGYRFMSKINRPSPPPLPQQQQREFEELFRACQGPPSTNSSLDKAEAELALHPDASRPVAPEFDGIVNPVTGEVGGPKHEPVRRWSKNHGDWSFKGRVSDF